MSTTQDAAKGGNSRSPRLRSSPSLPNLRGRHASCHPPTTRRRPDSPKLTLEDDDPNHTWKPRINQHYLTPPLTPSSSLKSDSTDLESTDLNMSAESHSSRTAVFGDAHQTRFLVIGNVPRDLSDDVIIQHLRCLTSSAEDTYLVPSKIQVENPISTTQEAIQTIDFRFRDNHTVIVALYDVRSADKIKRSIESVRLHLQHDAINKGPQKTHCESALRTSWKEKLTCTSVCPDRFIKLVGESAPETMTRTEGTFCVSVSEVSDGCGNASSSSFTALARTPLQTKVRDILSKYGDIKVFHTLNGSDENHSQGFIVEYFDIRAAEAAWEDVNGRAVDTMKLQLALMDVSCKESGRLLDASSEEMAGASEGHIEGDHSAEPKTPMTATFVSHSPASLSPNRISLPILDDIGSAEYRFCGERSNVDDPVSALAPIRHSVPLSEYTPSALSSPNDLRGSPADNFSFGHSRRRGVAVTGRSGRRGSRNSLFDVVRREPYTPIDVDHTRHLMNSVDCEGAQVGSSFVEDISGNIPNLYSSSYLTAQPQYGCDYFSQADIYTRDPSMHASWVSSPLHSAIPIQYPLPPQSPMPSMYWDASTGSWFAWPSRNHLVEQWAYPPPTMFHSGLTLSPAHYPYSQQPSAQVQIPSYAHHLNHTLVQTSTTAARSVPENNQFDVQRIEQGLDTRTTVMIKNIPNKMTDKELIDFINDVCPRRIDFLYLRMDFQNGCNVGYAFVNFISVEDLLQFANLKLNEKWNLYSSEKVLQMSYANYQGKEALVEKFKNSCIMDEREEWRPKIFYSEPGPKQGLPEEFPKPTHIRRKERSSFNRGALFVPGISAHQKSFMNASTTRSSARVDGRRLR